MRAIRPSTGNNRNLKVTAALLIAFGLTCLSVACGSTERGTTNDSVPIAQGGKAEGTLKISNWPLYIDGTTITDFEAETGIEVEYVEEVLDNDEFFGEVQPLLSRGNAGGRSIVVVSDWMSKKMYDLGFLQNLDPAELETVDQNMLPGLDNPSFDSERSYTVPWQSGITGLVVRKDLASDIRSINDLFDPKYKGKVMMLGDMRQTVPLLIAASGEDPSEAGREDWLSAIDRLQRAISEGQIAGLSRTEPTAELDDGTIVASTGFSGRTIQSQGRNPEIAFVKPDDGCLLWSDNMSIPIGAPNPAAAYAFMNYLYEPENMARVVNWTSYISPVEGTREILEEENPGLASNPLVFPSNGFLDECFEATSPPGSPEDVREVERAWQAVLNS